MKTNLYKLLLRRKELKFRSELMMRMEGLRIYEPSISRKLIHSHEGGGLEQVDITVPLLRKDEVERERDWYSHQWRLCDGAIQQANHTTKVKVEQLVMKDFVTGETIPGGVVEETLASLLSRRKMLEQKENEAVGNIDISTLVKKVSERRSTTDGVKDLIDGVKAVSAGEALAKQLHYTRALRLCEEAIQFVNANTEVEVGDSIFRDFEVT